MNKIDTEDGVVTELINVLPINKRSTDSTISHKSCCSNVKNIITKNNDDNHVVFIDENRINLTIEQCKEWIDNMNNSFTSSQISYEEVNDVNEQYTLEDPRYNISSLGITGSLLTKHVDTFLTEKYKEGYVFKILESSGLVDKTRIFSTRASIKSVSFSGNERHFISLNYTLRGNYDGTTNTLLIKFLGSSLAHVLAKGKEKTPIHILFIKYLRENTNLLTIKGLSIKLNFDILKNVNTTGEIYNIRYNKLFLYQILRYLWAPLHIKYSEEYFKIKDSLEKYDFMEILSLINVIVFSGNYYSPFPSSENGILTNSNINEVFEKTAVHSTNQATSKTVLYPKFIRSIRNAYKKGEFELAMVNLINATYGVRPEIKKITIISKSNFGFLSENTEYTVLDQNSKAFKIHADDFADRWYKKTRFEYEEL